MKTEKKLRICRNKTKLTVSPRVEENSPNDRIFDIYVCFLCSLCKAYQHSTRYTVDGFSIRCKHVVHIVTWKWRVTHDTNYKKIHQTMYMLYGYTRTAEVLKCQLRLWTMVLPAVALNQTLLLVLCHTGHLHTSAVKLMAFFARQRTDVGLQLWRKRDMNSTLIIGAWLRSL